MTMPDMNDLLEALNKPVKLEPWQAEVFETIAKLKDGEKVIIADWASRGSRSGTSFMRVWVDEMGLRRLEPAYQTPTHWRKYKNFKNRQASVMRKTRKSGKV